MRSVFRILVVLLLLAVELYAVYAVLHPRVSPEYRAYYIDRTTMDWHPKRYDATPESGIDFTKPGLPNFVRYTLGFSFHEPWGRWTDAALQPTATILMDRQFSGPLCIEFNARPSVWQRGKAVDVALGNNLARVMLVNPDYADYQVGFADARPADSLTFHSEGNVPANNDFTHNGIDGRHLGIQITRLKILPSACKLGS